MLLTRRVDLNSPGKRKNGEIFHRKSSSKKECIVRKRNVKRIRWKEGKRMEAKKYMKKARQCFPTLASFARLTAFDLGRTI